MSVTDYVIDILLILVIFRAVRPHPLTPRAALLPLALLAIAGIIYLRPVTLGGNDLALIGILAAAGIVLGTLSGMADRIWRDEQRRLWFRAGALSVIAWVAGMGFRFGFAYYAYHGGGPAVARFSAQHDLSGASIWTTARSAAPWPRRTGALLTIASTPAGSNAGEHAAKRGAGDEPEGPSRRTGR